MNRNDIDTTFLTESYEHHGHRARDVSLRRLDIADVWSAPAVPASTSDVFFTRRRRRFSMIHRSP